MAKTTYSSPTLYPLALPLVLLNSRPSRDIAEQLFLCGDRDPHIHDWSKLKVMMAESSVFVFDQNMTTGVSYVFSRY